MSEDDILARDPAPAALVRWLAGAYEPERIYLFGSIARGEARRDSDYTSYSSYPTTPRPSAGRAAWPTGRSGERARRPTCSCAPGNGSRSAAASRPRSPAPSSARGGCSMPPDPARAADARLDGRSAQDLAAGLLLPSPGKPSSAPGRPPRRHSKPSSLGTTSPFTRWTTWRKSGNSAFASAGPSGRRSIMPLLLAIPLPLLLLE